MDPFANAQVCARADSNSCDLVWNLTGNQNLALGAEWVIGKPLAIMSLILIGMFARWLLHKLIDRLTTRASGGVVPKIFTRRRSDGEGVVAHTSPTAARRAQRTKAMGSLLKSIVTGVIVTMVTMMVIAELGYDVGPLIASAGILGLALGFGAQSLVKDFLAGIFMIFEDQYGVGDVIDAEFASGTVEAVSLRVTRIRDVDGTVWYVRNGEILRIGNMSQNWARTVLDIRVAYSEDLYRVQGLLKEIAHDLWDDDDYKGKIIEEPEVWGVQSLDPEYVTVRVTLKTAPLEQWDVAREMRERIKARFDYERIEMPLPQRVVWHREGSENPGHPQANGMARDGQDVKVN
ncbi:MAG TPA: mechanosensitive ion channel family protein [Nocardioidaceae bacterium]|nr:mechanosensitive ion channel family protein [Nocardioidaceae bacterium]